MMIFTMRFMTIPFALKLWSISSQTVKPERKILTLAQCSAAPQEKKEENHSAIMIRNALVHVSDGIIQDGITYVRLPFLPKCKFLKK